ncbi:Rhomboid-related protein [Echinococcus granulosus]|uniref:Rhomboid-related protein n=1 Tax=Echinococcus granulosus TaxID=6210 RepID=W6U9J4_ECHGR|nr:Rhomboid-related protein [Echinococcus granulosus]EUB55167.1 Rhomboid-related protein [Echinococcus granulosus]
MECPHSLQCPPAQYKLAVLKVWRPFYSPGMAALTRGERELRERLDTYEREGGMPLDVLQRLLNESDIPPTRTKRFFKKADVNCDQRVNYDEFLRQIMFEDSAFLQKLAFGSIALNKAVIAVAPQTARRKQRLQMQKSGIDETDLYNWGEADVNNYIEAYDCRPPPIFIPFITFAQIAVFTYYAVVAAHDVDPFNDVTASSGVPFYSPLIYLPQKRYQAWRFLSYMFIHNGYVHLIFNCVLQLALGTLLELVHKFWRVGIVYLLGVVAGSLAHSVSDPFIALAGASGGCYALIGAHVATIITNWKTMQAGWLKNPMNFLSSGAVRLTFILLLAGADTGFAIYERFTNPSVAKVGFVAHLGGFAAGVLVGIPVLRNLEVERWEKVCFWVCIFLFAAFMSAAVLFNGFCEEQGWCPPTDWS